MSEYLEQAHKFLEDTNTKLKMHVYPEYLEPECKWPIHGRYYRVALKNERGEYKFDFWDSAFNKQNHKKPNAYDILASLDDNVDETSSIDDFVSDYGLDRPISETLDIYKLCLEQTRGLRKLFTSKQLEELAEIN